MKLISAIHQLAASAVCDRGAHRMMTLAIMLVALSRSTALAQPAFFPIDQIRASSPQYGASASPPNYRTQAQQISEPSQTPHPAIVRVIVAEKDGISLGSGTLIDVRGEWGLVISNWHVVRDAAGPVQIQFANGQVAPATVVKTDSDWDLAALSVHKPIAAPIPLSATAPQPGESLMIAGYGSGSYRVARGRVTQYLAPGVKFPYEIVELSAGARQGDSGGPILNERGELAGVLFGSAGGLTSGSYVGRVRDFLTGVLPSGTAATMPLAASPTAKFPVPSSPAAPSMLPPFSTELAQSSPAASGWKPATSSREPAELAAGDIQPIEAKKFEAPQQLVDAPLTHVASAADDLMEAPKPSSNASRNFEGTDQEIDLSPGSRDAIRSQPDERLALLNEQRDVALQSLDDESTTAAPRSLGIIHTPLPPRGSAAKGVPLSDAPADQLLSAAWKQIAGVTLYDQAKTVLAAIGVLCLLGQFYRLNAQPEEVHQEEE